MLHSGVPFYHKKAQRFVFNPRCSLRSRKALSSFINPPSFSILTNQLHAPLLQLVLRDHADKLVEVEALEVRGHVPGHVVDGVEGLGPHLGEVAGEVVLERGPEVVGVHEGGGALLIEGHREVVGEEEVEEAALLVRGELLL